MSSLLVLIDRRPQHCQFIHAYALSRPGGHDFYSRSVLAFPIAWVRLPRPPLQRQAGHDPVRITLVRAERHLGLRCAGLLVGHEPRPVGPATAFVRRCLRLHRFCPYQQSWRCSEQSSRNSSSHAAPRTARHRLPRATPASPSHSRVTLHEPGVLVIAGLARPRKRFRAGRCRWIHQRLAWSHRVRASR